ncbi:MAG TPA: RluA family pseudouridine synthase [Pseudomonadales bacterium]|nr:RluA family pseudouridine synthase [Pseudomonadales bacterium]
MVESPITHCEKSIAITANGKRAIDWLAENTPLSRMQLKKALACGAVWLQVGKKQDRLRRATRELPEKSILHVYFDAAILALEPPQPVLVADEQQYSVWYKPAGLLSQGSKQGDHCSLLRIVEQLLDRKVFLVHRLDREASGLMLVAHTEKAAAALSALFQSNKIAKHYRASVSGELTLQALPFRIDGDIDGKHAVTWIDSAVYDAGNRQTHLHIHIDTGRKHQIRRHLAGLGHPVVGDARYGKADGSNVMALQACRIEYLCPLFNRKRNYCFASSSA